MLQRIASASILLAACALGAFAQSRSQIAREASMVDDLANHGEYAKASQHARLVFDRLHTRHRDDETILFLAYLGKEAVEVGALKQADEVFRLAEAIAEKLPDARNQAAMFREKATLQYARAEYAAAASTASKAYQLSRSAGTTVRTGYCQSLEALALLRLGRLTDARKLSIDFLRSCPRKPGKQFLFRPRMLYAACLIESHAGNYTEALGDCERGLEMARRQERETRDLSLGYLAAAETYLECGDLARSSDAAAKSCDLTMRLFGERHQDMVGALGLLAEISDRQGDMTGACGSAKRAAKLATTLFGAASVGAERPVQALRRMKSCPGE